VKISLTIPSVNQVPANRPTACTYCGQPILHRHGSASKPNKDHRLFRVVVHRYKCLSCKRTFRHYPSGITRKTQSQRTVVLAALMYALGLSCSAASHLLGALGVDLGQMSVWRDAQQAGEALRRKRPTGRVRVLGADETVYKVKGRKVVVGFVVDGESGGTLGFEVLFEGDGEAFKGWLAPYAEKLGAEVLVSDDNDSYGVAAAGLGVEHQLCVAHVRKYVAKRSKSIIEQARAEWGEGDERSDKLAEDLGLVKDLLEQLREEGGARMGRLHRSYSSAPPPERKGGKASCAYRMRMLTLELWEKWRKLRLYRARPELGFLDGTNNVSERAIGKSKVRYKTMRGHKSVEGMSNAIALTQWLYNGDDEHDLAKEMAA
jgi:transposase-like protein